MPVWIKKIQKIGWLAVEAALLLIVLCVLLNIISPVGIGFISLVAGNATNFLQAVPPGTILGVVILVFLYWFIRLKK